MEELKHFVKSRHNPVAQIMKRFGELEGLSREQKCLESKASDNIRDSCLLVENGVVIIQSKLHNGDFVCNFYYKILLEDFLDTFIQSKEFDIFLCKRAYTTPTYY